VDKPRVFDGQGQERDWEWLIGSFGAVNLERAETDADPPHAYRVASLHDTDGPAAMVVHVVDQDDNPLEGIHVVRYWSGAPKLPEWPSPVSLWQDEGVHGPTNENGDIGFGIGAGEYYSVPNGGPCAVWVADEAGPSDLISGLGMLDKSKHRHLNVTFRLEAFAEPAAPHPVPPAQSSEPPAQPPEPPVQPTEAPVQPTDALPSAEEPVTLPPPQLGPPSPPPSPSGSPLRDERWAQLFEKLDLVIDILEARVEE
jgi:hypothetical protein